MAACRGIPGLVPGGWGEGLKSGFGGTLSKGAEPGETGMGARAGGMGWMEQTMEIKATFPAQGCLWPTS